MDSRTPTRQLQLSVLCDCPDLQKELLLTLNQERVKWVRDPAKADFTLVDLRSERPNHDNATSSLVALVSADPKSRIRALEWGAELMVQADNLRSLPACINELWMREEMSSEHVLVLEDCDLQCDILKSFLERGGCKVEATPTVESFFAHLQSFKPDLIVLDYQLEDQIDGAQVCRILKSDLGFRNIPVLIVTASEKHLVDSYQAGANEVILKQGDWMQSLLRVSRSLRGFRLERASRLDGLTGCMRRGEALSVVERLKRIAHRDGRQMCVSFLDIDHFKSVNDTHGHKAGDEVLRVLGEELRRHFREEDVVCRWGGEEFLVVLYNLSLQRAKERFEEFAERLKSFSFEFDPDYQIQFTAGIASFKRSESTQMTIERADRAMYIGKRLGRNRVELMENTAAPEIVLIEDDEDFASILKIEAELRGIKVRHYRDAESALKGWSKDVSAYLVDWDLPGISGTDFVDQLPTSQKEKTILISAYRSAKVRKQAKSLGLRGYVNKSLAKMESLFDFDSVEREAL